MGLFDKIKKLGIFNGFSELDDDFYDELEEALILSDMGMETALDVVDELKRRVKEDHIKSIEDGRECLIKLIAARMQFDSNTLKLETTPSIVLFIGVNGVGKTTTIGKLGSQMKQSGKKVLFAAGDTFRAAASEQLTIWAERSDIEIIKQAEGADPGSVVFDALNAAKARGTDVVMIDTAGRLHNKANLMNELNKISRIIERQCPDSSQETLLVIDATTGQNGLIQAKQFKEAAGLTGIVLTKMDGTAKGGIAVAIAHELGIPVKFIGVGEGISDLMPFDAEEYARALL